MADDNETSDKTADAAARKAADEVKVWLQEISYAQQREKNWRKIASRVVALYEGVKKKTHQYNILFANTDTLAPALYNSVPRPVVKARYNAQSVLPREAAKFAQALLKYLIECTYDGRPDWDSIWEGGVLAALLPGRAVTRLKYEAELVDQPEADPKVEGEGPQESHEKESPAAKQVMAGVPEQAKSETPLPSQLIVDEHLWGEDVPWQNFLHGYARRWANVPWIAFFHPMTKSEFEENFPGIPTQDIQPQTNDDSDSDADEGGSATSTGSTSKDEDKGVSFYPVYEIWDKAKRQIHYVSPLWRDGYLKESLDDPFALASFYPIPEPVQLIRKVNNLVPVCLYTMYEEQAEELNTITLRINKIIAALKIRGAYDSNIDALKGILEADDGTMVAIEEAAALYAQGSNIEKALFFIPIEGLMTVLQGLYQQRLQIKEVIFEITGLADIMRGSSQASETLGAQKLKNQWGSLRLRRMQKRIQRYVKESLALILELAVSKMQPERLKMMAGSNLPSAADRDRARAALQQAAQAQQPPDPQLQAVAELPSLEEVIGVLKNDLQRGYTVSIETNSTLEAEATEDKADVTEAMTALGQGLAGISPLVQQGFLPFDAAKAIMLAVSRKFRFGAEIDEYLSKMQQPQAAGAGGQGDKGSGEPAESPEVTAAKSQTIVASEQAKQRTAQMDAEYAAAEHQYRMEELAARRENLQLQRQLTMAKAQKEMADAMRPPAPPPAPAGPSSGNQPRRNTPPVTKR